MNESSGYGSNNSSGNSLAPLGSAPTPVSTSPQATLGQSPNNGYQQQQHHMRPQVSTNSVLKAKNCQFLVAKTVKRKK